MCSFKVYKKKSTNINHFLVSDLRQSPTPTFEKGPHQLKGNQYSPSSSRISPLVGSESGQKKKLPFSFVYANKCNCHDI